ncbi:hypothetical protein H5410_032372 [Solanum commersonii]|uniref:Uncharacterized protein n=1 Tax=Solanum commersonii TaxID=4109 RepID=A0A9J5YKU4_SOLCO|nr:hypothetical protein H5410_032372 [Solanum commersonii]KAH0658625.1 hypothetical protein KY289_027373 [Solanum tuberosum]KAH0665967.1 hypothetical protein KY285_027173 [Solanum tuberosum]
MAIRMLESEFLRQMEEQAPMVNQSVTEVPEELAFGRRCASDLFELNKTLFEKYDSTLVDLVFPVISSVKSAF